MQIIYNSKPKNIILNEKLSDYIKNALKKGYSKEQIKNYLINFGYGSELIDYHINFLEKNRTKRIFLITVVVFPLLLILFLYKISSFDITFKNGGIRISTEEVKNYEKLAYSYYAVGDYNNSLKFFLLSPNKNSTVLRIIGDIYRFNGNYNEAITYYNYSIKSRPNYPVAYYGKGVVYYLLGDYEKSLTNFLKAYDLNKRDESTAESIALDYIFLEDYESASNFSNQALKYNENSYVAYTFLARSYYMKKDYRAAIAFYQKAVNLSQNVNLNVLSFDLASLGISYLAIRDYNNSIYYLNQSLRYIELPHAYGGLAAAYLLMGNEALSEKYENKMNFNGFSEPEKRVLSLNMRNIARIYNETNFFNKTIQYYEFTIDLFPENKLFYDDLYNVYITKQEHGKAQEVLNRYKNLKKIETNS